MATLAIMSSYRGVDTAEAVEVNASRIDWRRRRCLGWQQRWQSLHQRLCVATLALVLTASAIVGSGKRGRGDGIHGDVILREPPAAAAFAAEGDCVWQPSPAAKVWATSHEMAPS